MKTRPSEFKRFIKLLMKNAPKGYQPHLFRCEKESKAPKIEYGSWKNERQRLTPKKALWWLKNEGNVGIAGMPGDPLVNVDIDDEEETQKKDLKPTLMARSRSRTGRHAWYFSEDEIPNITTDDCGEIRANGQYVVAPGSHVPYDKNLKDAGYYTVEEKAPVSWIEIGELPRVFLERHEKNQEENEREEAEKSNYDPKKAEGDHSALYEIEARDVVKNEGGSSNPSDRWTALFHDSSTDMNMSLSNNELLHCWRHLVSHNGLQALTVLSGYMSCSEAGSPHKDSGAGPSRVIGNDGAIFSSWLYAKRNSYIPKDDSIPTRAMKFIARKHDVCEPGNGDILPNWAYNKVLKIVEEEY